MVLGGEAKIKKTITSGCPFLRKQKLQKQFKEEVNQQALDIEDLLHLGRKLGTCPYYGSRALIPSANLVVLPYQSLLLKSARESLGVNLKDSIVIIDEAHNLVDALTNMHNSQITTSQLQLANSHLKGYLERFRNCLGAGNRRYIQMLMVLIQAFLQCLSGNQQKDMCGPSSDIHVNGIIFELGEKETRNDVVITIKEFLFSLDIDNINLVKLLRYMKESNMAARVTHLPEIQPLILPVTNISPQMTEE